MPLTITTNAGEQADLIAKINDAVAAAWPQLYGQLGSVFQKRVQDRIESEDNGTWIANSKWVQAKKGLAYKTLEGAGRFVKYKADGKMMTLYGDTGADWTLSMHDKGFENAVEQIGADGRIEIDIVDPGPLGLSAGSSKFSWIPKSITPDKTPARKIWDTETEVVSITTPIYSRWLQATINRAIEDTGASISGSAF